MRTWILTLLFLLLQTAAFACSCVNVKNTADIYLSSDYVGTFQVSNTVDTPDTTEWETYEAKITPLATFKGKHPEKLTVFGSLDSTSGFNCDRYVQPGEEYLGAISKAKNGTYYASYCSFFKKLVSKQGKNVSKGTDWRIINEFQFLKNTVPNLSQKYMITEKSDALQTYLRSFDGQSFNKKAAYYLLQFDDKSQLKNMRVLKGFSNSFDQALDAFIKQQTSWQQSVFYSSEGPLPAESYKILAIYYKRGDKKFLTTYNY